MPPLVEARRIRKIYSGGGGLFTSESETVAVDDFSLEINDDRPSFITIAGESRSGKTIDHWNCFSFIIFNNI